ncbi:MULTISPECIES: hypothetical protein [Alteribacter]|uniref:hypothetical protein n=1 Tax=Alteribacter TaxID=2823237 RepID=UPI0016062892|nr:MULTISPECIES: hypothetical protein [Alteribacter]MBM7095802.1 hypothetical protein [Alteribacter salitolerans]
MDTALNDKKQNKASKKESRLTLSEWMLKTIKLHKKRTMKDATIGITVMVILFVIGMV